VLRPGGVLFAAIISRYGALLDLLLRANALHLPGVFPVVEKVVRTGVFDGYGLDLFTTAYFHLPDELPAELDEAGFAEHEILPIEGPAAFVTDFPERWEDDARRQSLLDAARLVEGQGPLLAAGSHILGIAHP
jgi:hypothetical protein